MKIKYLVFPLISLFLVLFFFSTPFSSVHAAPGAEVSLSPSVTSPISGQTFTISITINTAGDPVNAAQVNLTYPTSTVGFIKVNTAQSAFSIQAEQKNIDGLVKIARGSLKPLSGEGVKFADVEFRAKSPISASDIKVASESMVIRSTDNTNILTSTDSMMQQQTFDGMPKRDPFKPSVDVKNPPSNPGFLQSILNAIFGIFSFGRK